jgi:hypothetical protein
VASEQARWQTRQTVDIQWEIWQIWTDGPVTRISKDAMPEMGGRRHGREMGHSNERDAAIEPAICKSDELLTSESKLRKKRSDEGKRKRKQTGDGAEAVDAKNRATRTKIDDTRTMPIGRRLNTRTQGKSNKTVSQWSYRSSEE